MDNIRILVVEDEALIAASIVRTLSSLGYTILEPVASGEDAVDAVQTHHPDLVLMDIELLSDMNGIETAEKIAEISDIPVIYLTAHADDNRISEASLTRPYGYLLKPVNQQELRITLEMALYKSSIDRKLKESETRYRTIVTSSKAGYFMIDLDGRYIMVNEAWLVMHGYSSQDEIIGQHFSITQIDGDKEKAQHNVDFLIRGGTIPSGEFSRKRKDGSVGYHTFSATPVVQDGNVTGIEGFLIDITKQKKVEEDLKKSEHLLSGILNSAPVLIYIYDLTGHRNIYSNKEIVKFLGYSPEQIKQAGSGLFDTILHPDDIQTVASHHDKMTHAKDNEIRECVYRMKHANGGWRLLRSRDIVFNRDYQGLADQILGSAEDITEHYQAEESLHMAIKKLHLLTSLTRHDIFNQVTAVTLLMDEAIESSDLAEIHRYASIAREVGNHIEATISFTREYENFGIVSSGWQPVSATIESAKSEVSLKGIHVHIAIPEDLEVYADPIIRKVFTTLMENAVRHGEKITVIELNCCEDAGSLNIICKDDGVGIPPEEKDHIFELGYGKNTGIGLFLAREILSITGLSIRECGEPGIGARFEILVPAGKFRIISS